MSQQAIHSTRKLLVTLQKSMRAMGWPVGTRLEMNVDPENETITITRENAKTTERPGSPEPFTDDVADAILGKGS
jgi:hypothetical protein